MECLHPECWDHRNASPSPASFVFIFIGGQRLVSTAVSWHLKRDPKKTLVIIWELVREEENPVDQL